MRRFVFWTGIYDVIGGIGLLVPGALALLAINLPGSGYWLQMVGAVIVFIGIVLIICSRDLTTRAPVVCWQGLLRIAAFLLSAGFAFLQDAGVMLALIGAVDLLIGLVYLIGLPRTLRRGVADLLLDRPAKPYVSAAR